MNLAIARPVRRDVEGAAHHGAHHLHVVRIVVVVHPDDRLSERIRGVEDDLAFAVVRLTESFVHTPAITGNAPAPERVGSILHALLDHERGASGSRHQ